MGNSKSNRPRYPLVVAGRALASTISVTTFVYYKQEWLILGTVFREKNNHMSPNPFNRLE